MEGSEGRMLPYRSLFLRISCSKEHSILCDREGCLFTCINFQITILLHINLPSDDLPVCSYVCGLP